ncbi:MAG: RDD family protein [Bdellovibrionaceae bacterium]|nr:RDD family protein [Pseudobdellovibrionaceae bacterium]
MVTRDFSDSRSAPASPNSAPYLDRFFANVIDFLILTPVISLFTSGIAADIRWALFNKQAEPIFNLVVQYIFISFSLFLLYEVLFIFFHGATPGHRFLYMRVETQKGAPASLIAVLFRSVLKFQAILFSCLPFIEIVLRADRSTFYDRAAGTRLVSLRQGKADEIHPEFRKIILRWTYTVIIFFFMTIGLLFFRSVSKVPDKVTSVKEGTQCRETLVQSLKNYLSKHKESESLRCARVLVEQAFDADTSVAKLNYLAQYIVTPNDELKESYKAKYCEGNGDRLICQADRTPKMDLGKLDDEAVINVLFDMNQALAKNEHARVFSDLDTLYTYVDWNRNLELYYLTSYVFLNEQTSRNPASEGNQKSQWSSQKERFLKRMSVSP